MTQLLDFVNEIRSSAEDYGDTITDNQTGDGTTTRWKASSPPIKTNSDVVTVAGAATTAYTINYDNGELVFTTAPTNGQAISVQYVKTVWRDERIISAINAGIREMFKDGAYKKGELYVQLAVQKWDYDLTSTTDVPAASAFGDITMPADYNPATARADIVKAQTAVQFAEYHAFGPFQPFVPFYNFGRTTQRDLHIDGDPTPGDTIRLTYRAPFTTLVNMTDVTDVPDELLMAPVWFALSVLLDKKEARRSRSDAMQVTMAANANPPGTQALTAEDYLARYKDLMAGGMRPMAMKQRRRVQSWELTQTVR